MRDIPVLKKIDLAGSIVPQLFSIKDDRIIYFDKINQYEGKFYIILPDGSKSDFEVGEGQGVISASGDMYLMKIEKNTDIIKYSLEGCREKHLAIEGLFFNFEVDEYDNYLCLGNVDGITTVKIINRHGEEAGRIQQPQMAFGSCIYVVNEDLYIGSCSRENNFTITRLNYIGNKGGQWAINIESHDRIIGKMQKYENYIFASVIGKYDSMIVLDTAAGKWREIFPGSLGLKNLIDFNIYKEKLYILDGKSILEFSAKDVMEAAKGRPRVNFNMDRSLLSYNYLMYFKGLKRQLQRNYAWSAAVTLPLLLIFYYNNPELYFGIYSAGVLTFSIFWLVHFTLASIMNLLRFADKSARINQLLDIYCNRKDNVYAMPFFSSLTVFAFVYLFLYPGFNLYLLTLLPVLIFPFTYTVEGIAQKNVERENEGIIIELLQDDDEEFKSYLRMFVEKLRIGNCERLFIDILSNEKSDKGIVLKWAKSREGIIGGINKVEVRDNRIIATLDMSKRDLKYSRYSILMDYVCYMKKQIQVREISIGVEDEQKLCN